MHLLGIQKSAIENDIIMVDVDTKNMLDSFVSRDIPGVLVQAANNARP